jgi:hypothetical protein
MVVMAVLVLRHLLAFLSMEAEAVVVPVMELAELVEQAEGEMVEVGLLEQMA